MSYMKEVKKLVIGVGIYPERTASSSLSQAGDVPALLWESAHHYK